PVGEDPIVEAQSLQNAAVVVGERVIARTKRRAGQKPARAREPALFIERQTSREVVRRLIQNVEVAQPHRPDYSEPRPIRRSNSSCVIFLPASISRMRRVISSRQAGFRSRPTCNRNAASSRRSSSGSST